MRAQADGYAQANVKPSLTDYDFLWVIRFFIIYKANFGIISRITEMNPYLTNVPILYPLKKKQKTKAFLVFSGGIRWKHWSGMAEAFYLTALFLWEECIGEKSVAQWIKKLHSE